MVAAGTPDRVKVECPECGSIIWASTRSGRAYSHNVPRLAPVLVCPGSSVGLVSASVRGPAISVPPASSSPVSATSQPTIEPEGPSSSIRAISGGLPSLGRRR